VHCIGRIEAPGAPLRVLLDDGTELATPWHAYDHFRT
ncbi:MAG: hypothetical protein RJA44_2583, partial [Pseudomonadota bacterium]